jgi:hypothetical protein
LNIGIVGHEGAKFTDEGRKNAFGCIYTLLTSSPDPVLVSGGCHLGGIDIWAEALADELGIPKRIFLPKKLTWEGGYKERNLLIAETSDVVHCLVVRRLPDDYTGMRFNSCYHCKSSDHIKSGGCWTARKAKKAEWHVIEQ